MGGGVGGGVGGDPKNGAVRGRSEARSSEGKLNCLRAAVRGSSERRRGNDGRRRSNDGSAAGENKAASVGVGGGFVGEGASVGVNLSSNNLSQMNIRFAIKGECEFGKKKI